MKNDNKIARETLYIENDNEGRNWPIDMRASKSNVLHRFLSFILIRGKRKLRVNEFNYNYRRKKDTISIDINKAEERMVIKLTPNFDYKSTTKLDVSVNGHKLTLELIFNRKHNEQNSIV